jgi:NAD(P)-dependent dehydrogenase (short-subunit alcohol dehydrogenase family)
MDLQLAGLRVLITAGASGIGLATARAFVREGARVHVSDVDRAALDALATTDSTLLRSMCDVADRSQVAAMFDDALRALGGLDVLVNNAGIAEEKAFLEIEDDGWDRILATNLRGAFLMAQRVARAQVASGGGSIVHIASIDASGGDGPYASYNASKAGLLGLSRTMALELGPHGVRVNCVSPGFTHTEMTEVGVPPAAMDYLTTRFDRVPMRRLVRPEEIASACAFLASDDASAITGIDLTVDCGLTANWYILESIPADG